MSWSRRHTRLALLMSLGLMAVGLTQIYNSSNESDLQPEEIQPPGRWHFQASQLAAAPDGDELARVLSLPYVSGSSSAPSRQGVVRHRPGAYDGVNLYVSGHGPEAILMDMDGKRIHSWTLPFEEAFPHKEPTVETPFFRRAYLYPGGDLLALYQGGGIIKLDRQSRLVWATDLPFYNHLSVKQDGNIVSIAKSARLIQAVRPAEPVLEDSIVTLSPDGEVLSRISLLECFANSPFADLIHPLPSHADIFHTNTVFSIEETGGPARTVWHQGDLLVSLREVDIIALVDPVALTVRSAWRGPWVAQHQPVPLPEATILLFDNRGGSTGSRILEFDPLAEQIVWEFSGNDGDNLSSPEAGSCQRLPNGNTLITDSEAGRALEISPASEKVWEFVSPHRAGPRRELVATLFEVVRIPSASLEFLPERATD
jgi:hypothetical protein